MAIVETIRFKLRDGIQESDFAHRDYRVEKEYMELRPGFISRQTARSADGEYLVVVRWETPEHAEATISAFFGAPETQEFLEAVDTSTVLTGRYEQIEH